MNPLMTPLAQTYKVGTLKEILLCRQLLVMHLNRKAAAQRANSTLFTQHRRAQLLPALRTAALTVRIVCFLPFHKNFIS